MWIIMLVLIGGVIAIIAVIGSSKNRSSNTYVGTRVGSGKTSIIITDANTGKYVSGAKGSTEFYALDKLLGDEEEKLNDCTSSVAMKHHLDVMEAAMEKARKTGVGFISVCNNNHTGANACHVRQAAEAGFIGMVAGNGPSMVAPFGSATPFFSTNPFSMGYPCAPGVGEFAGETSVIMDMATSVSARGKIILAAKEGRSIPTGWAVDSVGNDTSDPAAALKGALIPFGGHKGYAIAFMVEVLAGLLSGAGTGPSMPDHLGGGRKLIGAGNLFAAVNVELFVGLEHFCKSMREMVDSIRSGVVRPGFSEIMTPGQPEYRTRQRRKEEGIPLSDKVYDELAAEGMRYGLTMPSGR